MLFLLHLISATDLERATIAAVIISLMLLLKKKWKRIKCLICVKPWLTRRKTKGIYNNLVRELRL